jgi:hypothetical protein
METTPQKKKRKRILTTEGTLVYSTNPVKKIASRRLNYKVIVQNAFINPMIVGYVLTL